MKWTGPWGRGAVLRLAAGCVVIVTLVVAGAVALDRVLLAAETAAVRESLRSDAHRLGDGLSEQIDLSELDLRGMAGAISVRPEMSQEQYRRLARNLTARRGAIVNVAAAPDLVVRYVYPRAGNEAALGLDYRDHPQQYQDVLAALRTQEIATSDPLELVQGGTGLVLHDAVFVLDEELGTTGLLWGVVSVVLDFDRALALSGLREIEAEHDVAIRRLDAMGKGAGAIYGDQSIFDRAPILETVSLTTGAWQVGVVPAGGWPETPRAAPLIRGGAVLFGLALIAALLHVMRLRRERNSSRKRLQSAVEVLDDGFAIFDADDTLVMCNSRYRELYEVTPGLLVPGVARETIARVNVEHGRMAEAVGAEAEWLDRWRARLDKVRWDSEHQLDDGRWIKVSDIRTLEGGSVCVRVDITDLKQAREAAEAANEAKTNFLNTVSHELRTPLTVILGFNAFLRSPEALPEHRDLDAALKDPATGDAERIGLLGSLTRRIAKITAQIDNSGNLLLSLINSVLDWSKIEEGALQLDPGEVASDDLIEKVIGLLQPLAARKGLRLRAEAEAGEIVADPMRLEQVLINLTANAVKFSDRGEVVIGSARRNGEAVFWVRDQGCGIAEADLGLIFDRFRQVDSSQSRAHPGSGLGLAIARTIVELHGGSIWAESEIGVGSRFFFTVPVAQKGCRAAE